MMKKITVDAIKREIERRGKEVEKLADVAKEMADHLSSTRQQEREFRRSIDALMGDLHALERIGYEGQERVAVGGEKMASAIVDKVIGDTMAARRGEDWPGAELAKCSDEPARRADTDTVIFSWNGLRIPMPGDVAAELAGVGVLEWRDPDTVRVKPTAPRDLYGYTVERLLRCLPSSRR